MRRKNLSSVMKKYYGTNVNTELMDLLLEAQDIEAKKRSIILSTYADLCEETMSKLGYAPDGKHDLEVFKEVLTKGYESFLKDNPEYIKDNQQRRTRITWSNREDIEEKTTNFFEEATAEKLK